MKLLFMHLSDLHLSKNDDINEDAIAGIAQTLSSQNIGSINHVLVLVTGDIANAGKKMNMMHFIPLKSYFFPH